MFGPFRFIDRYNKNYPLISIFRTIGFVGDSMASGEQESLMNGEKGYNDYYEYSWGQFIARDCGLTGYNFSKGGLTAKSWMDLNETEHFLCEEKKCQAYVIALGENDIEKMDKEYPLGFGDISDIDFNDKTKNKDSFIGWYARIIQSIRELEPKARIFLLTCPKFIVETKQRRTTHDRHQKIMHELAARFEFTYVLDLRKASIPLDKGFNKTFCMGKHFTPQGYIYAAKLIEREMDRAIRKYNSDFMQVGFIGRDVHNEKYKW